MPSYKHFNDLYQEEVMYVSVIRTGKSTNFVGVSGELNKTFSKMNQKKTNEFIL